MAKPVWQYKTALRTRGAINAYGQLGNGTTTNSSVPVAITGLTNGVSAVAGGEAHGLALQQGAVYAWGNNSLGTLGNGTTVNSKVPVAVKNLSTGVTAIAVGADHSLAVQNGGIYSWGINYYGQLGNGTTSTGANATPGAVIGMSSGVTAIACGSYHSLAVQNGGVYAWGQNGLGALGNGTTTDSSIPVAVTNLASGVSAVAGGGSFSVTLHPPATMLGVCKA